MNGNTPKARAKNVKTLLKKQYDEGKGAEWANVVDMLSDLRHFCATEGIDFEDCDRVARYHCAVETRDNYIG